MTTQDGQIPFDTLLNETAATPGSLNGGRARNNPNAVEEDDKPFHEWYRFVLSYPPHLVRDYARRFQLAAGDVLLDPFCGTGTTLVEAKRNRLRGAGLEANPFPHFACTVKTSWELDPDLLVDAAQDIAADVRQALRRQGLTTMTRSMRMNSCSCASCPLMPRSC